MRRIDKLKRLINQQQGELLPVMLWLNKEQEGWTLEDEGEGIPFETVAEAEAYCKETYKNRQVILLHWQQ